METENKNMTASEKTKNFWADQIKAYEKKAEKWEKKALKIVKRYTKDNGDSKKGAQFNILWSNVQTLLPAIYDRQPVPNIERRFNKEDVVGREASTLLERGVTYFIDTDEFNEKMRQCLLDRLLVGRGTVWVRYEPTISKMQPEGEQVSENDGPVGTNVEAQGEQITEDVQESLEYEDVLYDYVHWEDFGHTLGRTWQEVRAVWRRVPMSRTQLVKRFGKVGEDISLNAKPTEAGKEDSDTLAEIYEIWDKETRKVLWLSKDHPEPIEEVDDPLRLKDFFPTPRPLYGTVANNGLIPTPDYDIYFDQAREIDILTSRIDLILQAVRVAGVYDAAAEGVQRLLSEQIENKLIPVSNWAVFGEKGGLKGVVDYMPLDMITATLKTLYEAREKVKQDLYEITGMSDIIRGASNPNETATAQQIKGQYATMRLGDMQKDMARFCRDLVRITAEIISNVFSAETIVQISSAALPTEEQKQQAMAMAQSSNQPMPEIMDKPSLEKVIELLKNDMARCFRISIETDSTIKTDQESEKKARTEFLQAAGGFIQQAAQIAAPELQPLLMDMLLFGIRGFKAGREIEGSFERAREAIDKKSKNPPPPDNSAAIEAQAAEQESKVNIQIKQMDMQIKGMDVQMKGIDMQIKQIEMQIERERASAMAMQSRQEVQNAQV